MQPTSCPEVYNGPKDVTALDRRSTLTLPVFDVSDNFSNSWFAVQLVLKVLSSIVHCRCYLSGFRVEASRQINEPIDQVTPLGELVTVTHARVIQRRTGPHLDHMATRAFCEDAVILHPPDRSLELRGDRTIAGSLEFQASRQSGSCGEVDDLLKHHTADRPMVTQFFQSANCLGNCNKPWFQPPRRLCLLRIDLIEQIKLYLTEEHGIGKLVLCGRVRRRVCECLI